MPRRKATREKGAFKTSLAGALTNVRNSLHLFGRDSGKTTGNLVISSNVSLGETKPSDPGVAVWFVWDGMQVCIPVDRYLTVEANLQAIHHIIEARRVEMRHGTLALVRASFTGFVALPAPATPPHWREVLGIGPGVVETKAIIEDQFKRMLKKNHPDMPGGSHDAMAELNQAREDALREIGQ
ncbi:J domain-containing protein [Rhizobium sp. 18065]|uniref:J domain-containing protein n=1 Tax=Rhizobium sp. 18065 TaxID=2681411 RepID=UPI001FCE80CA|nr:J domain-containing protein [Rhizobium sp. 18065]